MKMDVLNLNEAVQEITYLQVTSRLPLQVP